MTPAPVPNQLADDAWKALEPLQRLLRLHYLLGSATTTDNERQRRMAEVHGALDHAALAARRFFEAAEAELKRRDPTRV